MHHQLNIFRLGIARVEYSPSCRFRLSRGDISPCLHQSWFFGCLERNQLPRRCLNPYLILHHHWMSSLEAIEGPTVASKTLVIG